jgi:hypothetical protein
MERDLVIARNVFDLTHDNVSINHTSFTRRGKKKGRTYCPNTRGLELLNGLWLALDRAFLLVCQLLCNL